MHRPTPGSAYRAEDLVGFRSFYDDKLPKVFGFARARLDRQSAEDVVVEVFAAAAEAMRDGRGDQLTDSWLIAVARNKVVDRWRKAEREHRMLGFLRRRAADMHLASLDPHDDRVLSALDTLSARHRQVLALKYFDGCTTAQIAAQLGVSEHSAESMLARARRSLKVVLTTPRDPDD